MMTTDIGPYVYDVRLINDYTNRDIHLMRAHSIGELFDTLPDNIALHRWTTDEETRTAPNGKVIMKELGPECLRDFISIVSFRYGREGIHLYVNSQPDVRVHLNISPIGRSWSRINDGTNSGPRVAFDDWAVGEEE
jgi:hypothetical protein